MVKRIVVGVDGSADSLVAFRWALAEGRLWGAAVEAVMAWNVPGWFALEGGGQVELARLGDELEASAAGVLADAVARVDGDFADVTVSQHVVSERPATALLERARGADLLVVGSRGAGGFRGLLVGSVSLHCVSHAPCPVVVVRAEG